MRTFTVIEAPSKNDDAPGCSSSRGTLGNIEADSSNFLPTSQSAQASDEPCASTFETLQHRFSLLGYGLFSLTGDELLVTQPRAGVHHVLHGLGSARAFINLAGGRHV